MYFYAFNRKMLEIFLNLVNKYFHNSYHSLPFEIHLIKGSIS
jgi:hypothetical protein